MLPVTQIDTFYNGLTLRHGDTINATAGGSFMKRHPEKYYDLIENMTAHHNDWDTSAQRTIIGNTQHVYAAGAYQVVERETEATKDTVHPTNNRSTKDVQPSVVQTKSLILNSEPVVTLIIEPVASPVSAPRPNQRPSIPYPSRLHDQKLRDKANDQREKFFQIFKDLNFNISFADALILMPKFGPYIKSLLTNKDKLYFDADPRVPLILGRSFLKTGRALIDVFKEVDAFLALEDDPTSPEVDQSYFDSEGDILLLEAFLNDDPSLPLQNQGNFLPQVRKELKICEAKTDKSSIDEPPEEKTTLITVLKSHKRAIAWKLFDIKGIDPEFCTYKILMEEDFEPTIQHQRRVNPKIHDVIKQEVFKLFYAGLIYPISDSPW
nr:reverse transcriptase domain-containing protein [Tanacetum cinerariifolium]